MDPRAEMLAYGCREDDLAVLRSAAGVRGPLVLGADSLADFARQAIARRPLAIILGVGRKTIENLQVLAVIRAVRPDQHVIVVADEDSLDLERRVRTESIFYYLVHPVQRPETEAVLRTLLRLTPKG